MAPPPLPESTLVIAPTSKAGAKKKRRPVFRPGQRTAKAAASSKKTTPTKDDDKAEEEKTNNSPLEPLKVVPAAEKTTDATKTAATTRLPSALKKSKTTPTAETPAPAPKKGPTPIQAKKIVPANTKATSTQNNNTEATTTITPTRAKQQAKAVKPNEATTIRTQPGKKRKSTGLVIGASRVSPRRKRNQTEEEKEEEEQTTTNENETNNDVAANQLATVPRGRTPPLLPANLPPPKEGEVTLSQFCSSFKSKPHHPIEKQKKKQKQKTKEKEKEPEPEPEEVVPVVQVINGELVLQESSMVVEERGGASMRRAGADDEEYTVVEEDNDLTIVNADYTSFTNRTKPSFWTHEETKLFYEALRQVGTDFMLMTEFFKNRNRKQLKLKYKKELCNNPKLVDKALHPDQQKPLDLTVFQVTDEQVEEHKEAAKKKEIEDEQAKARAEEEAEKQKENRSGQENEMEVVEEDAEEDFFGAAARQEKSAFDLLMEASLPPEKPKWQNPEEDEVVEEDPMMLEEFQQISNFDEIPPTRDDEAETENQKDEPTLSLVPAANKKKKKQKFKTTRPGRKKK